MLEAPIPLDAAACAKIKRSAADYARRRDLSGRQKDELLADLAARTGMDYEGFCARRMFTLMTPAEVREAAANGADIQLHTHRHRVYREKAKFLSELDENRLRIEASTGATARHFCYPSGYYTQEFVHWLIGWGAESGVTCVWGLATRHTEAMLLPRLTDMETLSELEFRAWISGIAALRPPIGLVQAPVVGIRKHPSNFSADPLKTELGEIEVLNYVMQKHSAAQSYEAAIRRQIVIRAGNVVHAAFSIGRLDLVKHLLETVPPDRRDWKLRTKSAIARLPRPVARSLWRLSLVAGRGARALR